MTVTCTTRLALFGCVALLTACSNTQGDENVFTVGKALYQNMKTEATTEPDPNAVAQVAQHALANSDGALAIYRLEKRKAVAVIRPIADNGAYRSWASYGVSDRRSVSSRNGILTSTRGLGNDLMSSDLSALLSLVADRKEGTARIEQRYLDGENQIVTIASDCTVTRGDRAHFATPVEPHVQVRRMTAVCRQDTQTVNNWYLVTKSGDIVQSRHWAGPDFGYSTLQRLR